MRNKSGVGLLLLITLGWALFPVWPWAEPTHAFPHRAEVSSQASVPQDQAKSQPGCTHLHSQTAVQPLLSALPCGTNHRCCVSQPPAMPSALPVDTAVSRHGVTGTVVTLHPRAVSLRSLQPFLLAESPQPYSSLSMVLRI